MSFTNKFVFQKHKSLIALAIVNNEEQSPVQARAQVGTDALAPISLGMNCSFGTTFDIFVPSYIAGAIFHSAITNRALFQPHVAYI